MIIGRLKFTWTYHRQMAGDIPVWIEKSILVGDWYCRQILRDAFWATIIYLTIYFILALQILSSGGPVPPITAGGVALFMLFTVFHFGRLCWSGGFPLNYDEHVERLK